MPFFAEEICPYGDQFDLPEDRDVFEVMTPDGTTPEDIFPGSSIDFTKGDVIMISMADAPAEFFLLDLKFKFTGRVTVIILSSDGISRVRNVSYSLRIVFFFHVHKKC